jgi:hypothetical protein
MDYNMGYTLTFKCIFCYDFSIFFIETSYGLGKVLTKK